MQAIEELLKEFDAATQRAALYYLTRHIKQAAIFNEYQKNIFMEASDSEPSKEVKELTLTLIEVVEKTAGKKANEFSRVEFETWMDNIADIEDTIDDEPEAQQVHKAISELEKFSIPSQKHENGFLNDIY